LIICNRIAGKAFGFAVTIIFSHEKNSFFIIRYEKLREIVLGRHIFSGENIGLLQGKFRVGL
jgi:hypothetical protein